MKSTHDFLLELAEFLRGHGHDAAANDCLDHANAVDAAEGAKKPVGA